MRTHVGGELCERVVAVDSVVDFTFPDLGVNTRGLGVYAAAATRLDGRVLMLVGMNVALYSD